MHVVNTTNVIKSIFGNVVPADLLALCLLALCLNLLMGVNRYDAASTAATSVLSFAEQQAEDNCL